jgi:hypothetical protein
MIRFQGRSSGHSAASASVEGAAGWPELVDGSPASIESGRHLEPLLGGRGRGRKSARHQTKQWGQYLEQTSSAELPPAWIECSMRGKRQCVRDTDATAVFAVWHTSGSGFRCRLESIRSTRPKLDGRLLFSKRAKTTLVDTKMSPFAMEKASPW